MNAIVALGAVTVGINISSSKAELRALGLTPGEYLVPPIERMEAIRIALEKKRGTLPAPRNGGSIGNSANLMARACVSCGLMGAGGNDAFGRAFVANCEKASITFLSELKAGAVTGYDFYLYDEDDERTIVWTSGANALLSPAWIDRIAIQNAELLLLDGSALSFGPASKAALIDCIQTAEAARVPFVLTLSSTRIVAAHRPFFDAFAPQAQMVAGNLAQTAVLLNLKPNASLDDVRVALAKAPINALVTLDAAGSFAQFANEQFFMPTRAVEAVDSTGAGDNFLGAFIVAKRKGLSVPQALAVGNHIAGQVIQYDSARLPNEIDVPHLMQEAIQIAVTANNAT